MNVASRPTSGVISVNMDGTGTASSKNGLPSLLCSELLTSNGPRRSFPDPVMLLNDRVLANLLAAEERYFPNPEYFDFQPEIKPYMRRILTSWMLEVCEEQRCEEEVFVHAVNYVDRYLSVVTTSKSNLQLLGAACLFIASKFKEAAPFSAEKLVLYTDRSISVSQLLECELRVVEMLNWDISVVSPFDFLDQIFVRLPSLDRSTVGQLRRHCQTFISLCATEFSFVMYPASMIAGGSVIAAAHGILGSSWIESSELISQLEQITSVDADWLRACYQQIECLLASRLSKTGTESDSYSDVADVTSAAGIASSGGRLTTPTDAADVVIVH